MKCKSCGSEVTEGAKFCTNCGATIEPEVAPVVPEMPEPAPQAGYERVDAEIVGNANAGNMGAAPNPEGSTDYSGNPDINTVMQANGIQKDPNAGPIALSIASMVCGILSILCCCCSWFGLICAVAAIVLGIIAINKKSEGKGMAIAGIVCGGVGALIGIIFLAVAGASSGLSDMIGGGNFDLQDIEDFIDGL